MNIGAYSFEEFRRLAENFHGYAAPGLLIGGYMMEKAKAALPEGTLFEAVVETAKCLPDAVQLLSACSAGNQRLKIHNLGRYALTLFDKYTGKGVRVSLDSEKMKAYPEMYSWFFKKKSKKEQDSARLEREIREAGDSVCRVSEAQIHPRFIGAKHMNRISLCPVCREAYPAEDGPICRGCQGEAPYSSTSPLSDAPENPTRVVPVEEAVGKIAAHDMTRIDPGQFKGPEFSAGQRISPGDVCRLQQMGRFNVAVRAEEEADDGERIHENRVAEAFASRMAGEGIDWDLPPREGKIDFRASRDGVLCVDEDKLLRFNLVPEVMAAARQDGTVVNEGGRVAGTRAIPLYLSRNIFARALSELEGGPLFKVLPMRRAKAGVLVTGTEVFKGLIEDKFIPIITAKLLALGSEVVASRIVPDDRTIMKEAIDQTLNAGVDLIITTGGLSVDPDDITRSVLIEAGLKNVVHGAPVLPGTMSLVGELEYEGREVDVIGVPACALYYKTTFLDLILPRVLAGRGFTRAEAAKMGSGGYCLACKVCSWPKCSFGK
ncbi:MAG: trehalose-binding protein [Desulfovibrio sp.]|nr:trehalose-binding protein [Desulfovibrio sp.]